MLRSPAEPFDADAIRAQDDRFYSRIARAYNFLVKKMPLWKTWLCRGVPPLKGPRVLEVSFGTGDMDELFAEFGLLVYDRPTPG
jgi:ubiquinone/menaquinone biosynthesis C-methylase UbiE